MKKIFSIGLFTAAILFASCNFDFFNPTEPVIEQPADTPTDSTTEKTEENTTDKPDEKPADKPADKTDENPADNSAASPEESPAENQEATTPSESETETPETTPEFTAENDVAITQAPFNTEVCTTSVNEISLSNGDWTCEVYEQFLGIKMTAKASINNNVQSFSKGFAKIDLSMEDISKEFPSTGTEADFETVYNQIIAEYKEVTKLTSPFDSFTYSTAYITSDNRLVLIADINKEALPDIFNFSRTTVSTIMVNSNNTKYVMTDQSGTQIIYIYKDANLSDAEEVPQNDQTNPENQNEPAEGSGDTEDLGYTAPALEKSNGTDSLAGKSFGDEKYKYFFKNDGTALIKQYIKPKGAETGAFYPYAEIEYAYDATSKLLKYRWIKGTLAPGSELATYKEMIASMTEMGSMASLYKEMFETLNIAKAEIQDEKLSLQNDYFTKVPDIKNIFLQGIASEKVNGSAVTMELYGESRVVISGAMGRISIEMPHEGGTHVKHFSITEITADTIKVSGDNTLSFTYSVVCNSDGRLTFSISGNDDVTKVELGATEANPNPSYELRSAGASILEPITE